MTNTYDALLFSWKRTPTGPMPETVFFYFLCSSQDMHTSHTRTRLFRFPAGCVPAGRLCCVEPVGCHQRAADAAVPLPAPGQHDVPRAAQRGGGTAGAAPAPYQNVTQEVYVYNLFATIAELEISANCVLISVMSVPLHGY